MRKLTCIAFVLFAFITAAQSKNGGSPATIDPTPNLSQDWGESTWTSGNGIACRRCIENPDNPCQVRCKTYEGVYPQFWPNNWSQIPSYGDTQCHAVNPLNAQGYCTYAGSTVCMYVTPNDDPYGFSRKVKTAAMMSRRDEVAHTLAALYNDVYTLAAFQHRTIDETLGIADDSEREVAIAQAYENEVIRIQKERYGVVSDRPITIPRHVVRPKNAQPE